MLNNSSREIDSTLSESDRTKRNAIWKHLNSMMGNNYMKLITDPVISKTRLNRISVSNESHQRRSVGSNQILNSNEKLNHANMSTER